MKSYAPETTDSRNFPTDKGTIETITFGIAVPDPVCPVGTRVCCIDHQGLGGIMRKLDETHVSVQTLAIWLAVILSGTSVVQSLAILPFRIAQHEGMISVLTIQAKADHDLLITIETRQVEIKRLLLDLLDAHKLKINP